MKVGVQVDEELVEGVELEDIVTTVVGGGWVAQQEMNLKIMQQQK